MFQGGQGGTSNAVPEGGAVVSEPPRPAAVQPTESPEQRAALIQDADYQRFQAQRSEALQAQTQAAAREQEIKQRLETTTDSGATGQLQVDLAKARQDEFNARNAAAAAELNAAERKKVVTKGAPVIVPRAEPPVPGK